MEVLMRRLAMLLVVLGFGCGEDGAAGGGDAGVPGDGGGGRTFHRVLVALKEGNASVVSLDDFAVTQRVAPAMAISTDAVLHAAGGAVWVVNRYGFDNLVLLDPGDFHVLRQFSTGAGSNPQDVAVRSPTRAFVPLSGGEVLDIDPTQPEGAEIRARIDLRGIDANPTPTSAVLLGTELYVTLAFIDPSTYAPARVGMVVVIDTETNGVVAQIDLASENPFARMRALGDGGPLVVNGAADFAGTEGCFELVAPALRTASCLVTNQACGGWSGALAGGADGHVWAAVEAGFQADGTVCHFTVDGTIIRAGIGAANGSFTDVTRGEGDELYVVDTTAPGLRVFDTATDTEVTSAPLDLGGVPAFAGGIVLLP
jgi:hypothetical protein